MGKEISGRENNVKNNYKNSYAVLLNSYSSLSLGPVLLDITSGGLTMLVLQVRKLGLREVKGFV